jgi:DNA replication protein DnaC
MKSSVEICPLCEGSGWKAVHEGADRRVTRCDCWLKARSEKLLASARIPKRYEHCELSNFEFDGAHLSLAPARMAACRFVEDYPVDKTGLLIVGKIGRGKTHLAVGIAKALIREKGIPCLFYDYRELLKEIQNSYNATVQTTELEVLRPLFDIEVLILDELGAVKPTDWVWDTVSLLINSRYNDSRTTVMTTNFEDEPSVEAVSPSLSPAQRAGREQKLGDRITDRMRSRLHEMCRVIKVEGAADFRETIRSANFR